MAQSLIIVHPVIYLTKKTALLKNSARAVKGVPPSSREVDFYHCSLEQNCANETELAIENVGRSGWKLEGIQSAETVLMSSTTVLDNQKIIVKISLNNYLALQSIDDISSQELVFAQVDNSVGLASLKWPNLLKMPQNAKLLSKALPEDAGKLVKLVNSSHPEDLVCLMYRDTKINYRSPREMHTTPSKALYVETSHQLTSIIYNCISQLIYRKDAIDIPSMSWTNAAKNCELLNPRNYDDDALRMYNTRVNFTFDRLGEISEYQPRLKLGDLPHALGCGIDSHVQDQWEEVIKKLDLTQDYYVGLTFRTRPKSRGFVAYIVISNKNITPVKIELTSNSMEHIFQIVDQFLTKNKWGVRLVKTSAGFILPALINSNMEAAFKKTTPYR